MAVTALTRRSVMSAIVIAPVAIVSITPAAAVSTFDHALSVHLKAKALCTRYEAEVFAPALRRYEALDAAIPHSTVQWTGWMGVETWSTAEPKRVKDAHYYLRPCPLPFDAAAAPYKAACEGLVAADAERNRRLDAAKRLSGLAFAEAHLAVLEKAEDSASKAVALHPVSTAADLARKLIVVAESAWWDVDEVRDSLTADAKRCREES